MSNYKLLLCRIAALARCGLLLQSGLLVGLSRITVVSCGKTAEPF